MTGMSWKWIGIACVLGCFVAAILYLAARNYFGVVGYSVVAIIIIYFLVLGQWRG